VAVLQLLKMESRFKGVRVRWTHEEHPIWVEAERGRLEQVLMNLLLNAGDAMGGDGEVYFQAEESGPYWNLHVVDSGPGIPEVVLPQLFDPFFTTKEEGVGTGLGLAISRRIVNSCGGDIHAQNTEDSGARFTIRLYRASHESLNE
jgi:C4-dicarboxylate-specific signal transduction histidine kinase